MKWLWIVVVVFVLTIFLRPLWHAGFPYTHDGENHLARIENYFLALRQGQIPPRWAPNLRAGYGYPVFNYNYPLANILAAPFLAVKTPVEITLKILLSGGFAVGAYALWMVLQKRTSMFAATVGVLVWITAPFTYSNLYVRGAIGEVLAYSAFLWTLYVIDLVGQSKKRPSLLVLMGLFIGTVALSLSHNILALFLVPTVIVFAFRWLDSVVYRRMALGVIVLGLFSTTFFWIPALFEKNLVTLDAVSVSNEFAHHFPTISELMSASFQFGYSYSGPVDSLQFQIGVSILISCVFLILYGVTHWKEKKERGVFTLPVLTTLLVFCMLPASTLFWRYVPFLHYIQFPWRLLGFVSIVGAFAAAYALQKSSRLLQILLVLSIAISVLRLVQRAEPAYFSHDDLYYRTFAQTTTILDENRPRTLIVNPATLSENMPIVAKGVELHLKQWNGSYRTYFVSSSARHQVIEPTVYFPGWRTTVDGKKVEIDTQKASGLITFSVPEGEHEIVTEFTQWTWPRVLGNGISAISMGLSLWYVLHYRKHR